LVVVALIGAGACVAQQKPQQATATLQFVVVKDDNGKPVRNAEIVLHEVDKHGQQTGEGIEIKTHEDGKAEIGGIRYGKVRVQVIAPGFRTFGEDYAVGTPDQEITVKLQRPKEQYSIYK